MPPVIDAHKLYKRYPGFAPVLRGADIQVEAGEMVAVMGPSGCGKSTMLHILGMLHAPDSGTLEILNTNVLTLTREETAAFRRSNMGFVMQSSNLFEHSTVFENVEFPLIYDNVPPQERWERVIRALDLVGLSARVHYPGNRLSGGEQQRVAIARAMVNNPRILLADEPTGALDERTSRLIMRNFRNLCHSGGVAMVMVTHDPNMADFCDTVYRLQDGVLVCQKHGHGPYATGVENTLLKTPDASVNGALVAGHFPSLEDPDLAEIASRLSSQSLLSRIYSLDKYLFRDNSAGYSLSLPVRRMGLLARLAGFFVFFKRARASDSLWRLWKSLPVRKSGGIGLRKRLLAFSAASILARWALQDNIQFFYACSAAGEATSAWAASRLLRRPFAFHVRPQDLSVASSNWVVKANDACFVAFPSKTVMRKFREAFPEIPDKCLELVYPPPVVMPAEEETYTPAAQDNVRHLEIVTSGGNYSRQGYVTVLAACARLKQTDISFRLSILGKGGRAERKQAEKMGLKLEMQYLGEPKADTLAESFKTAAIFIAQEPDNPASKMILPVYLREAMAYGVAVASVGMSEGMAELLRDNENCLCAGLTDVPGLAANLDILCKDASGRMRLASAGRRDLESLLNLDATTQKIADLMNLAGGELENNLTRKGKL